MQYHWLSTRGGTNSNENLLALPILSNGSLYNGHWTHDNSYYQRPVLYTSED